MFLSLVKSRPEDSKKKRKKEKKRKESLGSNLDLGYTGRQSESESHAVASDSSQSNGLNSPGNSPGQNTEVSSLSLLQGVLPTQGSDPGLLHGRQILYQLSHKRQLSELDTPAGKTEAVTVTQICRSLSGGGGLADCELGKESEKMEKKCAQCSGSGP